MNTFIVANPEKCIGCKACEVACAVAHLDVSVSTAGANGLPFVPRLNLVRAHHVTMPVQCHQCDDAPCANVCPTQAIVQKNGVNSIITDRCNGCKSCILACPFGVIDVQPKISNGEPEHQSGLRFETSEGEQEKPIYAIHKCDLCAGRAGGPACVEVCPASAFTVLEHEKIMTGIKKKRLAAALDIAGKGKF